MTSRQVRRSLVLALIGVLAFAGVASADTVRADDPDQVGSQTLIDLGSVAPGQVVAADVDFILVCANGSHLDPDQAATLTYASGQKPLDGAIVSVTQGSTAPAPPDWPVDGEYCPYPAPTVVGGTPSTVTLQAPSTAGAGYEFTVIWSRSVSPAGIGDGSSTSGFTTITFRLEVVADTPPVLTVPAELMVEGDTTGGWTADWSSVTAADAEDEPDPTPLCSPAAGEVLPLGTTAVSCSAQDAGGNVDTGTFDVTVVDSTPPTLAGVPGDQDVSTSDPGGAVVEWPETVATDTVDAEPTVSCSPASGEVFAVGTTTVTCRAEDGSGNVAEASFDVRVAYEPPSAAVATWGEPVGADTGVFVATRARTLPVKVVLMVDGEVRTVGVAQLAIVSCTGGGPSVILPLAYGGGRWNAALDTSGLPGACHTVTASIDGLDAGSFRLDIRGSETLRAKARAR